MQQLFHFIKMTKMKHTHTKHPFKSASTLYLEIALNDRPTMVDFHSPVIKNTRSAKLFGYLIQSLLLSQSLKSAVFVGGFLYQGPNYVKIYINNCTTIHKYPIFSTRYSATCKFYTGYHGTSGIEHGLCACTVDNPLAKARGLSLRAGAQTMLYLLLVATLSRLRLRILVNL